ncbi:MAG: aldehyde dehydrogenase family protein [Gemmatimonadales bacterium]
MDQEVVAAGATVLLASRRQGNVLTPGLLANVPRDAKVSCKEIFGPVSIVAPYTDWADAMTRVNDSDFGLCRRLHPGRQPDLPCPSGLEVGRRDRERLPPSGSTTTRTVG